MDMFFQDLATANLTKDDSAFLAPPPSALQPVQYIVMLVQFLMITYQLHHGAVKKPFPVSFCKLAKQMRSLGKNTINNHVIEFGSFMAMFIA